MPKKEEGISYVRLDSPLDARRAILNAAIESTYILKHIESYKALKVKKIEKIQEINRLMRKINNEALKLRKVLPKEDEIKGLKKPEVKVKKRAKAVKVEKKDSIDKDLEDIKSKLDSIEV